MGGDFQQYRANVACGRSDCAYTTNLGEFSHILIVLLICTNQMDHTTKNHSFTTRWASSLQGTISRLAIT